MTRRWRQVFEGEIWPDGFGWGWRRYSSGLSALRVGWVTKRRGWFLDVLFVVRGWRFTRCDPWDTGEP